MEDLINMFVSVYYGDGYGDGSGCGSGEGISKYNGQKVHLIDGVQTIIENVKANYAKGYTLQNDLTLRPCFVARVGEYFAHGETLKDAVRDARTKHNANLSEEERINMFVEQFEPQKAYPAKLFFEWHNILTGSCEYGRREFCRERGIDIDNDLLTVTDFFELTKNSYGRGIIINLMSRY